jgi:hypothetical protein
MADWWSSLQADIRAFVASSSEGNIVRVSTHLRSELTLSIFHLTIYISLPRMDPRIEISMLKLVCTERFEHSGRGLQRKFEDFCRWINLYNSLDLTRRSCEK